jgi:hypothetical protein
VEASDIDSAKYSKMSKLIIDFECLFPRMASGLYIVIVAQERGWYGRSMAEQKTRIEKKKEGKLVPSKEFLAFHDSYGN